MRFGSKFAARPCVTVASTTVLSKPQKKLLDRASTRNLQDQWVVEDVPHLRIIDHDLWYRVQDQANRCLQFLSKTFNLAEVWGLRPDGTNPCRHVAKYPENKRERFLDTAKLHRVERCSGRCKPRALNYRPRYWLCGC